MRRGYTLIELIMVMAFGAIVAIVIVLAVVAVHFISKVW